MYLLLLKKLTAGFDELGRDHDVTLDKVQRKKYIGKLET